nr:zinc finger, BED-type, phospholipase-like, homeodomain-like protein [Tanacetum cinerariifolium]
MATQSTSTSIGVGSSNEPTIVEVIETTRNKDIWQHYDLCKMSDGSVELEEAGLEVQVYHEALYGIIIITIVVDHLLRPLDIGLRHLLSREGPYVAEPFHPLSEPHRHEAEAHMSHLQGGPASQGENQCQDQGRNGKEEEAGG